MAFNCGGRKTHFALLIGSCWVGFASIYRELGCCPEGVLSLTLCSIVPVNGFKWGMRNIGNQIIVHLGHNDDGAMIVLNTDPVPTHESMSSGGDPVSHSPQVLWC